MAKSELYWWPLGPIITAAGAFRVRRGERDVEAIRTAVQLEELPSLNRLPRFRKALNRLRPLIETAQGRLALEEIPARMTELIQTPLSPVTVPAEAVRYVVDDPNAPPRIIS